MAAHTSFFFVFYFVGSSTTLYSTEIVRSKNNDRDMNDVENNEQNNV